MTSGHCARGSVNDIARISVDERVTQDASSSLVAPSIHTNDSTQLSDRSRRTLVQSANLTVTGHSGGGGWNTIGGRNVYMRIRNLIH